MDNKDLIWYDLKNEWPKQNHYYYKQEAGILVKDELGFLTSIIHAEKIEVEVTSCNEAWIKYNAQKKSLDYKGLKIRIYWPKSVTRVHFGGGYYDR